MLFTPGALTVEAFGVHSGEAEYELAGVTPLPLTIVQTFASEESVLLWNSALVTAQQWWRGHLDVSIKGLSVLELGAGLGVCGMTLASLGASRIVLTEIEPALTSLRASLERNRAHWEGCSGHVHTEPLRWGQPCAPLLARHGHPDILLCCDTLYARAARPMLLDSIEELLPVAPRPATLVVAFESRGGDEDGFLCASARRLGLSGGRVYGPDELSIEIHVFRR